MDSSFLRDVEIHFSITGVCLIVLDLYFYFGAYHGLGTEDCSVDRTSEYSLIIVSMMVLLHANVFGWVCLGNLARTSRRRSVYSAYNFSLTLVAIAMIINQCVVVYRLHSKDPDLDRMERINSSIVIALWLIILMASTLSIKIWYYIFCGCCCKRIVNTYRPLLTRNEVGVQSYVLELRDELTEAFPEDQFPREEAKLPSIQVASSNGYSIRSNSTGNRTHTINLMD